MLKSKIKLIIRFLICWIVPAFIFSWVMRIEQMINYKYKIGYDWSYALNNSWIIEFGLFCLIFFVICVAYFLIPIILKIQIKSNNEKFLLATFTALAIVFILSLNSVGGHQNIFSSFRPLIVISLIGISVPLTDNLTKKLFFND